MRRLCAVALAVALAGFGAYRPAARADDLWEPAFDPRYVVSPPLGKGPDGEGRVLRVNPRFRTRAAPAPHSLRVLGAEDVMRVGEVVVVAGDPETITSNNGQLGVDPAALGNVTQKALAFAGDHYEIVTVWQTFVDRGTDALAYALNVKNDVAGLGKRLRVQDLSRMYGSQGVLRTVVNMKDLGLGSTDDRINWDKTLETWGQETGHRFMAFLEVRDPRTGRASDLLLGRDCAHFDWFVDTRASVQDGLAWVDNANGTFTWNERAKRFGPLDLYGMGLMPADELPPFFAIVDVPNYTRPSCEAYQPGRIPTQNTVSGTRLDLTSDDLIAANGPREPAASSGYVRELQVVLTRPNESVTSVTAVGLAQRIDRARLWWEDWVRVASGNRLVVCSQSTQDCGDARSDVVGVEVVEPAVPRLGPVAFRMDLANTGALPATGLRGWIEVRAGDRLYSSGLPRDLEPLPAGATRAETFMVDLPDIPCGAEMSVVGRTQSAFHYDRRRVSRPVGVKTVWTEDFESEGGWSVNPEGTDTGQGATWERGKPELSFVVNRQTQPDAAHGGAAAFSTGRVPPEAGSTGGFAKRGRVTLQSPVLPLAGLRQPALRYFVTFAGMRSVGSGQIESSPQASLSVYARAVGDAPDAGADSSWTEIDRLSDAIFVEWQERVVAMPPALAGASALQLRFVAADDHGDGLGGVEAAIDDVSMTSVLPGCETPNTVDAGEGPALDDEGGCGCRLGGRTKEPRLLTLVCLLAWLARRRRSTSPPSP